MAVVIEKEGEHDRLTIHTTSGKVLVAGLISTRFAPV